MTQPPVSQDSHSGCLVRIFWMFLGNIILCLCLTYVFHNRVRGLALVDLGYWLTVAAMVAVRWLDIRSYQGYTVTGEPATIAHWRQYAVRLAVGALIVWVVMHLLTLTGSMVPSTR